MKNKFNTSSFILYLIVLMFHSPLLASSLQNIGELSLQSLDQFDVQFGDNLNQSTYHFNHFYLNLGYSVKGSFGIIRYGMTSNVELKYSRKTTTPVVKEKQSYEIEGDWNDIRKFLDFTYNLFKVARQREFPNLRLNIKKNIEQMMLMARSTPKITNWPYTLTHLYVDVIFRADGKVAESLSLGGTKQIRYKIKLPDSPSPLTTNNVSLGLFKTMANQSHLRNTYLKDFKINRFMIGISRSRKIPLVIGNLRSSFNYLLVFSFDNLAIKPLVDTSVNVDEENFFLIEEDENTESLTAPLRRRVKRFSTKRIKKQFNQQLIRLSKMKKELTTFKAKYWELSELRARTSLNGRGSLHLVSTRGRPLFEIELRRIK